MEAALKDTIALDPLSARPRGSPEWNVVVTRSKADLSAQGMLNLEEFLRPGIAERALVPSWTPGRMITGVFVAPPEHMEIAYECHFSR